MGCHPIETLEINNRATGHIRLEHRFTCNHLTSLVNQKGSFISNIAD